MEFSTKLFQPTFLGLALGLFGVAGAQTRFDISASGVDFGGNEGVTYLSYSVRYALTPGLDLIGRGTDTKWTTFVGPTFNVRSGGDDHELIAYYRPSCWPNLDAGAGVAYVNTPARDGMGVITYDAGWTPSGAKAGSVRVGVRGILASNPVSVAAARVTWAVPGTPIDFIGEVAVPFSGENAINTSNGNRERVALGRIGFQVGERNRNAGMHFALTLTNELGTTTGMSMTPSLGSVFSPELCAGIRF